jgi:hypothetical protein
MLSGWAWGAIESAVIARSTCDEAIQLSLLLWIASLSLAMTNEIECRLLSFKRDANDF